MRHQTRYIFSLFWLLLGVELFLPAFHGELIFDSLCMTSISLFLGSLVRTRCATAFIKWTRLSFYFASLLYLTLMLINLWDQKENLMQTPSDGWRSLTHAWYILSTGVIGLSSPWFIRFFSKLQNNPARFIAFIYTGFALLCSLLLVLPISLKPGVELSYLDAFFTAVSAISGTGLVVVNTAETFSMFGYLIILMVIQAGGIGIVTFSSILLLLIGRELGLNEKVMQDSTERLNFMGDVKRFVLIVSGVMLAFQGVGAALLLPWFLEAFNGQFFLASFHALFHSVSAFCTAGFTTLPGGMIEANGAFSPLFIIACLALIGMLGLPTIVSLLRWLRKKGSLPANSKMELLMAGSLIGFGTLSIFLIELNNPIYSSSPEQFLHAFFQSSMRNAGFNSVTIAEMNLGSIFVLLSLMIVGGAPMSTAGGVKTATIACILIFVVSFLKRSRDANFAGRRLSPFLFLKAVSLIFIFLCVLFFGYLLLLLTQDIEPLSLLFESVSALTVTGLSLGATPDLNNVGKSIIIALMMVGRIGMLTAVYALILNQRPSKYRYPQGDFYVG